MPGTWQDADLPERDAPFQDGPPGSAGLYLAMPAQGGGSSGHAG